LAYLFVIIYTNRHIKAGIQTDEYLFVKAKDGTYRKYEGDPKELHPNIQKAMDAFNKEAKDDGAMLQSERATQAPGGIDFNPQNLELEIQGNRRDVPFTLTPENLDRTNFEGFYPVIFNITPVTNIPLILGSSEETDDEQLSYNVNLN